MVFLVTIVLQVFSDSERVVTSRIISSHNFSTIIETNTEVSVLLEEFNDKLNQFIQEKREFLKPRARLFGHIELVSVSTVKL